MSYFNRSCVLRLGKDFNRIKLFETKEDLCGAFAVATLKVIIYCVKKIRIQKDFVMFIRFFDLKFKRKIILNV